MKFTLVYFTHEIFRSPISQRLLGYLSKHAETFVTFPALIAGEIEDQIEINLQELEEKSDNPFLFVGVGHTSYWTNYFANRFLSPRILIEPFITVDSEKDFVVFHGVPGLVIHTSDSVAGQYPKLLSAMYQMNEVSVDDIFDFSEGSPVPKIIDEFVDDLSRFAI